MDISLLLKNQQIGLRTSSALLKNAIGQSIAVNVFSKTNLLEKKKEASKKRIRTLANIQSNLVQEKRTDRLVDNIASGAGLLSLGIGGGRGNNITPRNNIVSTRGLRTTKPGRFSGLSRFKNIRGISRGNVILNTAFAGLDFKNRKSLGQTNTQALAGAGGGAVGGIAGAAIGQALIPIPVIGALIGGFIGANLGSGVADRMTGVTSADFRRREEEKQTNLRENARTEFTEGLDRFDSALDKFGRYNEETDLFVLAATGRDKDGKLIRTPTGGGGVGQAFVNEAYRRGIAVGVSGIGVAIVGTFAVVKGLPLAIGLGKKLLMPMVTKIGKTKLFQNVLKFFRRNADPTKRLKEQLIKKRLLEQTEKEKLIEKILKNFKTKELEESIKLGEEFSRRVDTVTKGLKEGSGIKKEFSSRIGDKVKIKNFLDDLLDKEGITNIIKKGPRNIDKNLRSDASIIDGGSGNDIAFNREDSPYTSTLNNIRAFNQMTV